jgi:hypothetical protein
MKRALLAMAVVASGCHDFGKAYDQCVATGSCQPEGTGGGGVLGHAQLKISPAMNDFAVVSTGAHSDPQVFTVSNAGPDTSGSMQVELEGGDPAAFAVAADSCSNHTITVNETCTFTVSFAPTALGAATTNVTVKAAPGGTATAMLSGSGTLPSTLSITPASRDFGSANSGAMGVTQTFDVTTSAATGVLAVSLIGANPTSFTIVTGADTCSGLQLQALTHCTVDVRFEPKAQGAQLAKLQILGSPGGVATVTLTGQGLAPGSLVMNPSSQTFSATLRDTDGPTHVFLVTNTGATAVGPLDVAMSGAAASDFLVQDGGTCAGAMLANDAGCSVQVLFHPTGSGNEQASLAVGVAGGSAVATLSGTVLAPATLTPNPASHDFGQVVEGDSSGFTFHFTNTGDVSTPTLNAGILGTQFTRMNDNCTGIALDAGASCQIDVAFGPTMPGDAGATLLVGPPNINVPLTGQALAPGALMLSGSLAFGQVAVGSARTASVSLFNTGGASTGAIVPMIGGSNVSDVSFTTPDTCTGNALAAGGNCSLTLKYVASVAGSASASLYVNASPGGAASLQLTATGTAPLTVNFAGTGIGTVRSFTGLACTSNCTNTMTTSPVTLSVTPDISSAFTSFSGCDSQPMPDQCTVAMTGPRTVVATFTVIPEVLTVGTDASSSGQGTITSNPAGINCGSSCSHGFDYGTQVSLTAVPQAGSVFSGWTGACAGMGACMVTMDQQRNVNAVFTLMETLTIAAADGGQPPLFVGTADGKVSCGTGSYPCTYNLPYGTSLVLGVNPGAGTLFSGWGGTDCSGGVHTCNVFLDHAVTATVSTVPIQHNLIFMTPVPTSGGNFGGVAYADTACNNFATDAGLNNATNNGYVAFLSQTASTAGTRLGTARGWQRLDGQPFADDVASFIGNQGKIFAPIVYDVKGDVAMYGAWTGTQYNGTVGLTCNDWTTSSPSLQGNEGGPFSGPFDWFDLNGGCNYTLGFICMGKTLSSAVTPTPAPGKKLWLTADWWAIAGGPSGADAMCQAERPWGVTTAKAVLGAVSPPRQASDSLNPATTYVRVDGMVVGTGAQIIGNKGVNGVWQRTDGGYGGGEFWTGFDSASGPPLDVNQTCNDWTSSSIAYTGWRGEGGDYTGSYYFWNAGGSPTGCNAFNLLLCAEQ